MKLEHAGFVGWRGMVGSVLMQRMQEEGDFDRIENAVFFTTSQAGKPGPVINGRASTLEDAFDLDQLETMDVIVTCQGGDYTSEVHPRLRERGWNGFWIDAASTLRMAEPSIIILDPVNMPVIEAGLAAGSRDFIGGNCTVSLMMMALDGLLNADLVEWISVSTYQAISGGGAAHMREMLQQMRTIDTAVEEVLDDPRSSILEIDRLVTETQRSDSLPQQGIGYPLAGSLLPWIDKDLDSGTSREEWKGSTETNKILGRSDSPIPIESTCIRIGTMRCHSQAFTMKLNSDIPLDEIEQIIGDANEWVRVVSNTRAASLDELTPAAVTGTLDIPVGRIRKLHMGGDYISAFTVGDQLLWGAAEPLRRMIGLLSDHM